ncbi:GIY-YIG nuclease family protein [Aeoliella mucimassa]|uniref:GIY-YIG nuclease family protein n=1 Tax=Aeoliella mucimassa TaxID=2527972 RepID=UPI0018D34CC3|nr:GIY-YIG nuclease family protein [Aeoliella mucimassa]
MLILLFSVFSLLMGNSQFILLLGVLALASSGFLAIYFSQLHISIRKSSEALEAMTENYALRSRALEEAVNINKGFKLNFDELVNDEYRRLAEEVKQERDESMERIAWAENKASTVDALGKRFLKDSVKWISSRLTPNNYTASRDKLQKVIDFCRKSDFVVTGNEESELFAALKSEYEKVLLADHARQEQARIKAQIREEKKAEKELEREMQRVESERKAIELALEKALSESADQHSTEIEALRAKLLEAEERAKRTQSMAELTKAGYIYVISNLGSFGVSVFKIGMTRRLEPMDRVKELGDASVPFPFDVHMMISCDNAPALEHALHKAFHHRRVNKVNLRKEYFSVSIEEIAQQVEALHGEVEFVADAEALEFYESRDMSPEDYAYVTGQLEAIGALDDEGDM